MRIHGPPREHLPPQVHVALGTNAEVVIRLGSADLPPTIRAVYNMSSGDVIRALLTAHHHRLTGSPYTFITAWPRKLGRER